MNDLRQWRQFIAVAEELHFGRAAARLHMTQPPLTMAIKQLEAQLGAALFERTRRVVALTPAGESALPLARKLVADAQALQERVRAAARGLAGRLRLGFVSTIGYGAFPQWLSGFRQAHNTGSSDNAGQTAIGTWRGRATDINNTFLTAHNSWAAATNNTQKTFLTDAVALGRTMWSCSVPLLVDGGLAGNRPAELVFGQMLVHRTVPTRFRIARTARKRCTFTALQVSPVALAMSAISMSSTNRRRKTVFCLADRLSVASQTARTCSRMSARCSCVMAVSGSQSAAIEVSTAARSARRQNRRRRLRM